MGFINGQVHIGEHIDSYHRREEISASMVKDLLSSPEEFHWNHILKRRKESTAAMDFGTAVHEDQLLAVWDQSYKVIPKEVLSSNGARRGAAWLAYQRENEGSILLKEDQISNLKYIREAILNNPVAVQLLSRRSESLTEISITAEAPLQDGSYQKVRGRVDMLTPDSIIDFKTIADMGERTCNYRPYDHKWDVQAVMYQLLVQSVRGGELPPVYFLVVETSAPFRCEVFKPTESTLAGAALLLQDAIEEIIERTKSGNWHRDGWPEPFTF